MPECPLVEVYPENIPAFNVLLATADQWEVPGGFGGRLTLPMADLRACMDMLEIPITQANSLRVMGMVRAARVVKLQQLQAAAASKGK